VKHYGYTNFAGRAVSGAAIVGNISSGDKGGTYALASIAALAVLAAGGYFFARKKKID